MSLRAFAGAITAALILTGSAGALSLPVAGTVQGATLWTVGGTGAACSAAPSCGDGGPATSAALTFPQAVAVDAAGDLYIADMGDNEVRRVTPGGVMSIVAGDGSPCETAPACGDGGPATAASLNAPAGVALDAAGDVLIADSGDGEIREVNRQGTIVRLAGTGSDCSSADCGDGARALDAPLTQPDGVAVDRRGVVFIADSGDHRVRRIDRRGTITTVAGDGTPCAAAPSCGDGGPATAAQLNFPESVALDARGDLYVADNGDQEIRRVDGHGVIRRVAGTGQPCAAAPACGDGGPATRAALNLPAGVAVDSAGSVLVADWGDNEVRVISARGTISRLAGSGAACATPGACGSGGAASAARLSSPNGIAVDAAGNVYVADTSDDAVALVPRQRGAGARAGASALLAFAATPARRSVTVRYLLDASARVSLSVRAGRGAPVLVAHGSGAAGMGALTWNRRLGGRLAPRGRYTLIVSARFGRALVSSGIALTL